MSLQRRFPAVILLVVLLFPSFSVTPQATSLQDILQALEGVNRNLKGAKTQIETELIPLKLQGLLPHLTWKLVRDLPPPNTLEGIDLPLPQELLTQLKTLGIEPQELPKEQQREENKIFVLVRQEPSQPPLGLGLNAWSGRLQGALCSTDIFIIVKVCSATPPGIYQKLYDVLQGMGPQRQRVAQLWLEIELKGTIPTPPGGQPLPGEGTFRVSVLAKKTSGEALEIEISWKVQRSDGALLGQGTTRTPFQIQNVPDQARIELQAPERAGSLKFKHWETPAGIATRNPLTGTVSGDVTLSAVYEETTIPTGEKVVLTVRAWRFSTTAPPQEIFGVPISANPAACSGSTPYQCQVDKNSQVTLTAPNPILIGGVPHGFAQWWSCPANHALPPAQPSCSPQVPPNPSVSVTMDASKTLAGVYFPPGEIPTPPGSGPLLSFLMGGAFRLRAAVLAAPTPQEALLVIQRIQGLLEQASSGLVGVLARPELPAGARPALLASGAATEEARGALTQLEALLQQQIQEHGGESVELEVKEQLLTLAGQAADRLTVAIREKERGETTVRESFQTKIIGFKFEDLNGNGQWEGQPGVVPPRPGNEPPIEGWEITLTGPEGEKKTKTDAQGRFEFVVRTPGTYTITEEHRVGWLATTQSTQELMVRVFPGETFSPVLFGNRRGPVPPTVIRGCKFHDLNRNGQRDPNEPGLNFWEISLSGPESAKAITDVTGCFAFTVQTAGTYLVREGHRSGWMATMPESVTVIIPEVVPELILFGNAPDP